MLSSILKCPIRGLYTNNANEDYIVSLSKSGEIGTVMHLVLEKGFANNITEEKEFSALWSSVEQEVNGGTLKYQVKNYARYRYQVMTMLGKDRKTIKAKKKNRTYNFVPEKIIKNLDTLLKGRPDLLVFKHGKPYEIKDYKSGQIFSDDIPENDVLENGESYLFIKEEYKDQLFYYAALVREEYSYLPEKLTIISTNGISVTDDCRLEDVDYAMKRFQQLKKDLAQLNNQSLARPSKDNCRYCNYRPGCSFRIKTEPEPFGDVFGTVFSAVVHSYGNFTIKLESGEQIFNKKTGIAFPGIEKLKGKNIYLTNIRKEVSKENLYLISDFTVIYIYDKHLN